MFQKDHPTGLLAGGAFAPYKRFAAGKTLAQGEFTPPEHVKSPSVSIKITTPKGVVIFMEGTVKIDIFERRFCAVNSEPPEAAENCAGAALPTPSI